MSVGGGRCVRSGEKLEVRLCGETKKTENRIAAATIGVNKTQQLTRIFNWTTLTTYTMGEKDKSKVHKLSLKGEFAVAVVAQSRMLTQRRVGQARG